MSNAVIEVGENTPPPEYRQKAVRAPSSGPFRSYALLDALNALSLPVRWDSTSIATAKYLRFVCRYCRTLEVFGRDRLSSV